MGSDCAGCRPLRHDHCDRSRSSAAHFTPSMAARRGVPAATRHAAGGASIASHLRRDASPRTRRTARRGRPSSSAIQASEQLVGLAVDRRRRQAHAQRAVVQAVGLRAARVRRDADGEPRARRRARARQGQASAQRGRRRPALASAAFARTALAAAAFFAAVLRAAGAFAARGSNSKPTLPSFLSQARKALNLRRVLLETKFSSSAVLPSASSLVICSRGTGCCRMILPLLKSQVTCAPTLCSQT